MKYEKFITLTLVVILVCTSFSITAGARLFSSASSELSNMVDDTGTIENIGNYPILGNLFLIKGDQGKDYLGKHFDYYYPVNLPEEFNKEDLRVEFKGKVSNIYFLTTAIMRWTFARDLPVALPITLTEIHEIKPDLEFDISINEEFYVGEPIPVEATLFNTGEKTVHVAEMGLELGTLDFTVETPDGQTVSYICDSMSKTPETITIEPGEKYSVTIDDITEKELFGIIDDAEKKIFEFTEGEYKIQGHYISPASDDTVVDEKYWIGELHSKEYKFKILDGEPDPEVYYLTIDVENAGEYATTIPEPGTYEYLAGSEVEVEAVVLVDCIGLCEFSHWSGDDIDGSTNPVETLTMDSDKSVVAHFILGSDNKPPEAHFLYDPICPVVCQPICFKSDSKDSDGCIVSYEWDFGDGNTSSGNKVVMHSYEKEGTYTVCLKITDDDGADNTYCKDIEVIKTNDEELGVIHGFVMTIEDFTIPSEPVPVPVPYPPEIIPVEDVTVTAKPLRSYENQVTYSAETDAEGYFRMENVIPDVYEVTATKEGYYSKPLIVKVFPGEEPEPLKILIINGEPRE